LMDCRRSMLTTMGRSTYMSTVVDIFVKAREA
jgi:hypothetical protein